MKTAPSRWTKDTLHLIVIGPPGSGKGTQCSRLAAQYNLEHISIGDLLRREMAAGSILGQYLDDHWQLHKLSAITTDLAIMAIKKALSRGKGFVLDGSPRTVREAELLATSLTASGIGLDGVIEFEVDQAVATKRLLARRVHQASGRIYNLDTHPPQKAGMDDITGEELTHRSDDLSVEGIEARFHCYQNYGSSVSSFFRERPEPGIPRSFSLQTNVDEDQVYAQLVQIVSDLELVDSKRVLCNMNGTTEEPNSGPDDRDGKSPYKEGIEGAQCVGPADTAIILQQLKLLVRSHKPASRFPGCHPVSLTGNNIKQMLDDDYRAAPKLDGERRFLVLLHQHLYLVDRRMQVERFPAARFPSYLSPTVFDGELVAISQASPSPSSEPSRDASQGRCSWYFVIFDVLCAEGAYVCHMPLHERLSRARPVVDQLESTPFKITYQDYYRLDRLLNLLRQQRSKRQALDVEEEDTTVGVLLGNEDDQDDDDFENNIASLFPTDGLLFVPVYTPYRLGYCERMMKWKAPDQNTIDFTLRSVMSTVEEEVEQGGEEENNAAGTGSKEQQTEEPDAPEMNKEQGSSGGQEGGRYWQLFVLRDSTNYVFYDWIEFEDGAPPDVSDDSIVECHWDPTKQVSRRPPPALIRTWGQGWSNGKGGWRFHRSRADKTTPNAEWVVRNIEESIWDNLKEEDITTFVDQNAATIHHLVRQGPRFRSRSRADGASHSGDRRRGGGNYRGRPANNGHHSHPMARSRSRESERRSESNALSQNSWERGPHSIRDRNDRSADNGGHQYRSRASDRTRNNASPRRGGRGEDASTRCPSPDPGPQHRTPTGGGDYPLRNRGKGGEREAFASANAERQTAPARHRGARNSTAPSERSSNARTTDDGWTVVGKRK